MIGTIRKHSAVLWWTIIPITILSFVWYMNSAPSRGGGGGAVGSLGTLYGREVTPQALDAATKDFMIFYWFNYNGQWPSEREGMNASAIRRESYIRLLLGEKAKQLGIRVSDEAVAAAGAEMLRKLGNGKQPVPPDVFAQQVLQPQGLTPKDLENYLRSDIAVQQTIMALGLPGALIAPQEAAQLYDRENQEISAQAVFFSYSNYLAQVTPTAAAVEDFYSKNMAAYREPERVEVSYVAFHLSNYLAAAEQSIGRTNLDNDVETQFRQYGVEGIRGAKNAEEAKKIIRESILRAKQISFLKPVANEFATAVYAEKNLEAVAQRQGFPVLTPAPFANNNIAADVLNLPETFVRAAFKLAAEKQQFSELVNGTDSLYLLALKKEIPSSVPPLEQVRSRATDDYRAVTAQNLARNAGAIFHSNVTAEIAAGKTFAAAATAAGHPPVLLKPFALNAAEIPEVGDRAEIRELKQAAFTTPLGKASNFILTSEGGFVLSPQALEPINVTKKNADLPQFLTQVRRARQNQAFNEWLQTEIGRELRDTPIFAELTGGRPAK
jgi:hypothetical protein